MAFGDRFRNWWSGDDDDDYDSAFDDDIWADLGIDRDTPQDTWFDDLTTTITPIEESNWIDDWSNFDLDKEYGIGSLINEEPNIFDEDWAKTYDFGDWGGSPTVDFEDPSFDYSSFDVDDYLDSLLDFGDDGTWGGESYTEGDPSDWFIDAADYSGVGGGMPSPTITDPTLLKIATQYGLLGPNAQGSTIVPEAQETGIFGGKWGPLLRDAFLGPGGLRGRTGSTDNKGLGGLLGALTGLLSGRGDDGGGLLGGGGLKTLLTLAAINKLRKEKSRDPAEVVPVGADVFSAVGQGGGDSPIDYRVMNLQPALMPGVAYANVGKPEGMKGGGIASLEGSGDVTPAWLEPGEFVMTKKATGNIGAQNLYKMMKEAEGMS